MKPSTAPHHRGRHRRDHRRAASGTLPWALLGAALVIQVALLVRLARRQ